MSMWMIVFLSCIGTQFYSRNFPSENWTVINLCKSLTVTSSVTVIDPSVQDSFDFRITSCHSGVWSLLLMIQGGSLALSPSAFWASLLPCVFFRHLQTRCIVPKNDSMEKGGPKHSLTYVLLGSCLMNNARLLHISHRHTTTHKTPNPCNTAAFVSNPECL